MKKERYDTKFKLGADAWNQWREKNPENRPDLREYNLSGKTLKNFNLTGANLTGANLTGANLTGANLTGANLTGANLTGANLKTVQALKTNFQSATISGACLEDWNINNQTNFNNVVCDYIYLKQNQQERRPSNPNQNFKQDNFAYLVQKALNTVDLIFSNGIDWQAFLASFQNQQAQYGNKLAIQAIEKKSGGAFVIRVEVPLDANKAEVEKYLEQEYKIKLKAVEDKYRLESNAKNEEIKIYREKSADILELVKLGATINYLTIHGDYMPENSYSITGDNNQAVQGNNNQVTQESRRDTNSGEEITQAEVIELLAELEQKISSSELPEGTRTKTLSRLNAVSEDVKEAEPDKQLVAGNLKRVTENLSQATKATEEGKKLWSEVFPILKTVGTWVGLAGSFFSNLL